MEGNSDNDNENGKRSLDFLTQLLVNLWDTQCIHDIFLRAKRKSLRWILIFTFRFVDCSTLRPPHFTQPDFIADLKANIWNSKLGLVICSKLDTLLKAATSESRYLDYLKWVSQFSRIEINCRSQTNVQANWHNFLQEEDKFQIGFFWDSLPIRLFQQWI